MDTLELDDLLQRGYRYALSLCHHHAQAQDLLQDACMALSRNGGPWKISYLYRTIRNRHIDHFRRSRIIAFEPLEHAHEPAREPPHEPAEAGMDDDLERAMAELKSHERELIYLHAVEGYTAQELAHFTGRSRGAVLSLLHRAKQKLRGALAAAPQASPAAPP